jgi:hypothetical protein
MLFNSGTFFQFFAAFVLLSYRVRHLFLGDARPFRSSRAPVSPPPRPDQEKFFALAARTC